MASAGGKADLNPLNLRDQFGEKLVHRLHLFARLRATAHIGLVGSNHENIACVGEPRTRLGGIGEQLELRNFLGRVRLASPDHLSI